MDRIVYVVVTEPGGVDGRDPSATGGDKFATFYKDEADVKKNNWDRIEKRVIDVDTERAKAIKALSPLARLVLDLNP